MIVIHGEQTHVSRQKLIELIQQAKTGNQEVITISAKNLTPADLETQLGSESLFGNSRLVVIEELHSLPVSARRKALIEQVKTTEVELILWEKRSLTKTQLKALNPKQVYEFKPTSNLFKWLDSLSPNPKTKSQQLKLLKAATDSDGAELCLIMLARQTRLLIQAKTHSKIAGAPFMITKLNSQAQAFTIEQLLKLHTKLLELDLAQKTNSYPWSLTDELDLLVIRL